MTKDAAPFESHADDLARLRSSVNDLGDRTALERVVRRLSELVADNEALCKSERNWRLVLDNIAGMVAVLAADGTAQFVNRRIIEYTGITRLEEFKEWGTNGLLHAEDLAHVAAAFTKSLASGSPYQIVHRVRGGRRRLSLVSEQRCSVS
jgi:PAS domain S-box-containing protein